MEQVGVPDWLLQLEAIVAGLLLVLSFWPLTRAVRFVVDDLRLSDRWVAFTLVTAVLAGAFLRAAAEPTLLYAPNEAFSHLAKLFWPSEHARWHAHAGMGGYVLVASAASVFGRDLGTVTGLNVLGGAVCIVLMYLFALRAFRDHLTAVVAAALLALHVPQIRIDSSDQLETFTTAYSLLTYAAVLQAVDERRPASLLAAAIAGAAAVQMRPGAILHVGLAGLLYLVMAWRRPRAFSRWFWCSLGIFALLVLARAAVALNATTSSLGGHRLRLDVVWDAVTTWRHVYAHPRWSAPIYPVLSLIGLIMLAVMQQIRLLLLFVCASVLGYLLFFNEWLLDLNDSVRFEAPTWFLLIALAAFGLAALARRTASSLLRRVVVVGSIAIAAGWIFVGRALLFTPLGSDADLAFFKSGLLKLPAGCRLYTLDTARRGSGYYGPRYQPSWLFRAMGREESVPFPEARPPLPFGCHVAYLGLECYRWYLDDRMNQEEIMRFYLKRDRPALYTLVDDFLRREDDRNRGTPMRPECGALSERFELEPLETSSLPPGRGGARIWSPQSPVNVGFYRLNPKPKGP